MRQHTKKFCDAPLNFGGRQAHNHIKGGMHACDAACPNYACTTHWQSTKLGQRWHAAWLDEANLSSDNSVLGGGAGGGGVLEGTSYKP